MYSKYILVCLLGFSLFVPQGAAAQKGVLRYSPILWSKNIKNGIPNVFRTKISLTGHRVTAISGRMPFIVPHMTPERALAFSRALIHKNQSTKPLLHKPKLVPFEQYVRHFIFTVSPRGQKDAFKGSGFVFAEQQGDKTVLWGLSGAHVVRYMGTKVDVTFYAGGEKYTYPAEIVLTGRKYGLNAALIKLPQKAAEVARPVIQAAQAPQAGDALFTFGFSAGTYKKTLRRVLFAGSERVVANFPVLNPPKPGFCGSLVLNSKGEAVGIEVGGYSPQKEGQQWYQVRRGLRGLPSGDLSRISEIVPLARAYDLLAAYRHPGQAARKMWFDGIPVGELAPDEFVASVTVRYANGHYRLVMRNPFMELAALEKFFSLSGAVQAEIIVNKKRTQTYMYVVNLETRKIEKQEI